MAIEALKDKPWYVGLGIGIGVAVVLLALGSWQLFTPMKQQIERKDQRLAELEAKIQEGRAAKARLPQFREEVRRLELELEKLLRILPAQLNTEDLLRRLRSLGEQGDLDIRSIRPGNLSERDFYQEWPINLQVSGNYHNLAIFFDRIGRFPRIINIDNLQVAGATAGQHTVTASFVAKTFVYKRVDLATEGPAEAGSP